MFLSGDEPNPKVLLKAELFLESGLSLGFLGLFLLLEDLPLPTLSDLDKLYENPLLLYNIFDTKKKKSNQMEFYYNF